MDSYGVTLQGVLKANQKIEVCPGIVVKDESGNIKCTPGAWVPKYPHLHHSATMLPLGLVVEFLFEFYKFENNI